MPGTPALVVGHAHRRACAPLAAAGGVRTVGQVLRSHRWVRWAGSCSTGEHCTSHAAARDERPPRQPRPVQPLTVCLKGVYGEGGRGWEDRRRTQFD